MRTEVLKKSDTGPAALMKARDEVIGVSDSHSTARDRARPCDGLAVINVRYNDIKIIQLWSISRVSIYLAVYK